MKRIVAPAWCFVVGCLPLAAHAIDFNRDVRPILSNHCFKCHGPDSKERKGGSNGLRLDTEEGAREDLGGYAAVVPGKPDKSAILERVTHADPEQAMPPKASGRRLNPKEIETLTHWIREGAPYARHWSYTHVVRPPLPTGPSTWPKNGVDRFVLSRLERERLAPTPEADRPALARRASLDLLGLPPTPAEVEEFVQDKQPEAFERYVDRLLKKETFGEHWARFWLDLARYADSAGYADDPPRVIWGFRDYVIRSFNANKPFDQFTVEQIAGDLLPTPTDEQLMGTAFHRNTLTNSEGGTNDEEFRNVAIVDRVNTTWTVWMGTSMTCCQCHNHKYDPLSQQDFFRFFAILNNTEDADRRDESPLLSFFSTEQKQQRTAWEAELAALETTLRTGNAETAAAQAKWEASFAKNLAWRPLRPAAAKAQNATLTVQDDGAVLAAPGAKSDTYVVELPFDGRLTALRLEALPHESLPKQGPGRAQGNFVLSRVRATVGPADASRASGRFVRIELPGSQKYLSLAEVQVFAGTENVALRGQASQSSTDFEGPAKLAIDGNTNGEYYAAKSTTHTALSDNPWWEVTWPESQPIERIVIWNRTDGNVGGRLSNFRVAVLNEKREPVWEQRVEAAPNPSSALATSGLRTIDFSVALADYSQDGFDASQVLDKDAKAKPKSGWSIGEQTGKAHELTLIAAAPIEAVAGSRLTVTLEQNGPPEHTLGRFRLSTTDDGRVAEYVRTPAPIAAILGLAPEQRTAAQKQALTEHFLTQVSADQKATRDKLAALKKQLADMKPSTVPIQREMKGPQRRKTRIQHRGNFLDLGDEVTEGVPGLFHALPEGPVDRLALARWLVSPENPLTPRVIANRLWEQVFGIGLVRTSEEFGAQGELPSHPELLDWLGAELIESGWNVKQFLRLLVTSASYRQSSKVTPALYERDPENRLLARGPRFRMSAEMVRDQALFVSGLLSPKMYGPSVRPLQPSLGVNAAFGGAIDWKTSDGPDRFRRGLYTEWRRSNPYPSMVTFDATNREVCTVRRPRTNTPLQALVTLNDPVYVEAAQALARRMLQAGDTPEARTRAGFLLCLSRPPHEQELSRLVRLQEESRAVFAKDPQKAQQLATMPIGPAPAGTDVADLAAWTVVSNVLLNLDEMFMKR